MTHITVTSHAIKKAEQRTKYTGESAKRFLMNVFKNLSYKSRNWETNKGREIKYWYLGHNRYEIWDGKHKIVFVTENVKIIELWGNVTLTYKDFS